MGLKGQWFAVKDWCGCTVIPSLKLTARPWRLMMGRLLSFCEGLFSGAVLVLRECIKQQIFCNSDDPNDPMNKSGRPCICGSWRMRPLTVKDGISCYVFGYVSLQKTSPGFDCWGALCFSQRFHHPLAECCWKNVQDTLDRSWGFPWKRVSYLSFIEIYNDLHSFSYIPSQVVQDFSIKSTTAFAQPRRWETSIQTWKKLNDSN